MRFHHNTWHAPSLQLGRWKELKILEKPLLGVEVRIFVLVCVCMCMCVCVCEGGGQGLLTRFAPFSYLNHSFILSLNVRVCVRFIVFLQISLCFLICQELCWIRGLCIYFTSSCFLFPVGGRGLRWSLKILGLGRGGGVSSPLHAM